MSATGHIFLVGFMGAGKSTVAEVLGARLSRPVVDLDRMIEQKAGRTIAQVFTQDGEEAFRSMESAALESLQTHEPSVVACGGGVVLRPENRVSLDRMGHVVYLQVSAGEAVARIGDTSTRPLLAGPSGTLAATALLAAREALYRSVAQLTIDTCDHTPEQVADLVAAAAERESW